MIFIHDVAEFARTRGAKDKKPRRRNGLAVAAGMGLGGAAIGAGGVGVYRSRQDGVEELLGRRMQSMDSESRLKRRLKLGWIDDEEVDFRRRRRADRSRPGAFAEVKKFAKKSLLEESGYNPSDFVQDISQRKKRAVKTLRRYEKLASKITRTRILQGGAIGAGAGLAGYGIYRGIQSVRRRSR